MAGDCSIVLLRKKGKLLTTEDTDKIDHNKQA